MAHRAPVPSIAVTAGDPCGIGAEVILKALGSRPPIRCRVVVIGDRAVFERTARRQRLPWPGWEVRDVGSRWPASPSHLFLDCGRRAAFPPGRPSSEAGEASADYLDHAVALWRAGRIDALVTAPVTKWAISRARGAFTGQTEYLARAMRARAVAMMFVSERLRLVLLTRHLPLRRVAEAVDQREALATVRLTVSALQRWFGVTHPHLAVCGVNPHAGEAGLFGDEERRVLLPAMRAIRREGVICDGPLAADGFFAGLLGASSGAARRPAYDAVVCWYHDQGLIPFKMVSRDRGCQLTVGLPIPRTSPDHGTAPEIAGRGVADCGSMRYALTLAVRLAGIQRPPPLVGTSAAVPALRC